MLTVFLLLSFYTGNQQVPVKEIKAKFVDVTIWEGAGSYHFKDKKDNTITFAFDAIPDKIPYPLLGEEAHPNQKYLNTWFLITYKTVTEQRGDSEDWISVKKIITIKWVDHR